MCTDKITLVTDQQVQSDFKCFLFILNLLAKNSFGSYCKLDGTEKVC